MPEKINLTGRWRFEEDFGFGKDSGYAEINQKGSHLKGVLRFSEQIDGEETFIVSRKLPVGLMAQKSTSNHIPAKYYLATKILSMSSIPGRANSCQMEKLQETVVMQKARAAHL